MSLILLQITSLIYIVLLSFFYFKKSRLSDVENKIYKNLLISNIVGLVIELCCFYTVANMDSMRFLAIIFTKGLLIYYLFFISIYTTYVFVISYKQEKKTVVKINEFYQKTLNICLIVFGLLTLVISFLPMEYYYDGKYVYSYGQAVEFLQVIFVFVMSIWIYVIAKKYKNIKLQKYLPIIIFVVLAGIGGLIQKIYPYILLTTPIET